MAWHEFISRLWIQSHKKSVKQISVLWSQFMRKKYNWLRGNYTLTKIDSKKIYRHGIMDFINRLWISWHKPWTSAQTKNRRNYELTMYCVLDRSSNKTSIENVCVIHVHTNVTQVCVYTGHAHVPVYKLHAVHLKCVIKAACALVIV